MQKTVLIVFDQAKWMCERLSASCPNLKFIAAETVEEAFVHAGSVNFLMALAPYIPASLISAMPRLEWVHALTTGYDNLLEMTELPDHVAISNSRGIHGPQMAELAVLSMLTLVRDYRRTLANQVHRIWERREQSLLFNRTVSIVGLGVIAEALAERCAAFGMRVTGVSDGRSSVEGFSRIYPRAQIVDAAAQADFLVVVVPYSPQTRHIVSDSVLSAMKPSAHLVNISRGGCVDEQALLNHLDAGSIAGAALDVFDAEPLPTDSPIWSHPKIIVTPHIGGMSDIYHEQVLPIILRHIEIYASQGAEALPNLVDRARKETV